jgi:hypothetical protein
MPKVQNVERQNVKRQNVERQNVEWKKRRMVQKVEWKIAQWDKRPNGTKR